MILDLSTCHHQVSITFIENFFDIYIYVNYSNMSPKPGPSMAELAPPLPY